MSYRLSICIATRNRCEFLAETLNSIARQCSNDVEIVVLDGASTDNTEQVTLALCEDIPNLRYLRQKKNGGVDRDFDSCVSEARGEYCWLMSDDDLLKPGAVTAVLEAISRGFELIVVNSEVRTFDLARLLDENRLRFKEDRIYRPEQFESFFADVSAYLTYIGAVVIRRQTWVTREREPYYGSHFIHVGVIFQAPFSDSIIVLHEPLISVRFGNTIWRPKEFEIRMIRWTDLIASLSAIPKVTRAQRYHPEPWKNVRSLMFYRAKGTYDFGEYRRWINPRLSTPWQKLKAAAIALFPGALANILGLLYCRRSYRDSNIHLLDMRASRFYFRNWFKNASDAAE